LLEEKVYEGFERISNPAVHDQVVGGISLSRGDEREIGNFTEIVPAGVSGSSNRV
jgi:hypothetical protein